MALLVDVREVPWRILEMMQRRILANREQKQRRNDAAAVRGFTRPRPQQRRMGATMSTYREPEPVPLVLGTPIVVGLGFMSAIRRNEATRGGQHVFTWRCQIYCGDGTKSIELLHTASAPDPATPILGAPGFQWKHSPDLYVPQIQQRQDSVGYKKFFDLRKYDWVDDDGVQPQIWPAEARLTGESRLIWDIGERTFVLPAGNGRFIVATCLPSAWSTIMLSSTLEEYYTRDNRYLNENGLPGLVERVSVLTQGVGNQTGESFSVKCALVDWSSVREVPAPTGLVNRLKEVLGPGFIDSTHTERRLHDWCLTADDVPGINAGATYEENHIAYTYPIPDYRYDTLRYEIARSHGISQIMVGASNGEDEGWNGISVTKYYVQPGSPSIYHYMQISERSDSFDESEWTPASWAELLNGVLDFAVPVIVPTNEQDPAYMRVTRTPFTFSSYTGPLPTTRYGRIDVDAEGLKPLRLKRMQPSIVPASVDPDDLEQVVTANTRIDEWSRFAVFKVTDWNRPAYCRQQLAALGFSSADLEP